MKMIYVGSLATAPDRDSNWIASFEKIGCKVIPFRSEPEVTDMGLSARFCRRLNIGRENRQLQANLLALAEKERPAWVHFRLPLGFDRKTIQALKDKKMIVTQYFNDDPFSRRAPFGLHWKFRHALSAYDGHFVYRASNIEGYQNAGAFHVEHCPPTYDPRRHFPAASLGSRDFLADACFIGHWEADWRVDCLDALVGNGFSVIVKGGMWDSAIHGRQIGKLAPITHAFGAEYNYIYANVIAGLCFFSKINNDNWTERALEIVAVGGVLVCERTEEAMQHFKDRKEACFFSSIAELKEIIETLKGDPESRDKIRAAGCARLLQSHDAIDDRAEQVYKFVQDRIGAVKSNRDI